MEGGLITPPALIGTGPLMGVTSGLKAYEALTAYAESQVQRDLKAWLGLLEPHERCLEVPSEIERVQPGLGAGSTDSRGHFAVYGPQIQGVGIRGGDAG
jgi:hypothetical protein